MITISPPASATTSRTAQEVILLQTMVAPGSRRSSWLAIMAVIADFPAYPEWAQGMKQAEVVEGGTDGRADRVHFELEATPIKDSYTLDYTWAPDGTRLAVIARERSCPDCQSSWNETGQ